MNYKFFKDISRDDIRKTFDMRGKIINVKQTSGPTLMVLSDGTKNFTFKAFIKPGVRAYPECEIGDYVYTKAMINERNGGIEAEVRDMRKLSNEEKSSFEVEVEKLNAAKYKPDTTTFSIESKVLESLKPRFEKVASIIRQAVIEGRPILLRHDADCDGYSSAVCMERAILGLMDDVGCDPMAKFQNYRRAPSKAPFYDYEDSVKDLSMWLRDKNRNNAKSPLIIITDNGSTSEDILSYKQMKLFDSQIVVVDHHYPGEKDDKGNVAVDYFVDGHINPYLEGHDMNVCSGMLGFELARFIKKDNTNSVMIPAMAGLLDHVDGIEKDTYVEIANKAGFETKYMQDLGEIVYLQSHYIRFQESREFVNNLFGADMNFQRNIVEMLTPELDKRYEKVRLIGEHYAKVEDYGKFYVVEFDGEKGTSRGQYPAVGKATNQIHAMFEEKLDKPVITMTNGSTFLTIRVGDAITGFSVPTFCDIITKKIPHTGAEGGGHEHAGSVKFVEYAKEDVLNLFKEYLRDVEKTQ